MNIAVVGTGYVGLVSGTCFAEMGNQVICVDIDEKKIAKLQSGRVTIYEPGLDVLFERNIKQDRLYFTTNLQEAIEKSQIIFLALPTPPGEDGSADLSYVLGVARQIGPMLNEYKVIVNKSTVPVGTAEKVKNAIAQEAKFPFDVVSNPEFLREGMAVEDFLKPDRVVVGSSSEQAERLMMQLYEPFLRQGNPVYFMDERSAEITKYAANAYLATRITFMNEIANLCEILGADVDMVRLGMGSDSRIGKRFLFPGIGYGGSCFPKDVMALAQTARQNHYNFQILHSVVEVNQKQRISLIPKIKTYYHNQLKGKHFAVWGLAFKPNTDDVREAPAIYTIQQLLAEGATVAAFDPEAMETAQQVLGDQITYAKDQYQVLKDADALIIATEWQVFRMPELLRMKELLKKPVIFDGRNLYKPDLLRKIGYYYQSIGRALVNGLDNLHH